MTSRILPYGSNDSKPRAVATLVQNWFQELERLVPTETSPREH